MPNYIQTYRGLASQQPGLDVGAGLLALTKGGRQEVARQQELQELQRQAAMSEMQQRLEMAQQGLNPFSEAVLTQRANAGLTKAQTDQLRQMQEGVNQFISTMGMTPQVFEATEQPRQFNERLALDKDQLRAQQDQFNTATTQRATETALQRADADRVHALRERQLAAEFYPSVKPLLEGDTALSSEVLRQAFPSVQGVLDAQQAAATAEEQSRKDALMKATGPALSKWLQQQRLDDLLSFPTTLDPTRSAEPRAWAQPPAAPAAPAPAAPRPQSFSMQDAQRGQLGQNPLVGAGQAGLSKMGSALFSQPEGSTAAGGVGFGGGGGLFNLLAPKEGGLKYAEGAQQGEQDQLRQLMQDFMNTPMGPQVNSLHMLMQMMQAQQPQY